MPTRVTGAAAPPAVRWISETAAEGPRPARDVGSLAYPSVYPSSIAAPDQPVEKPDRLRGRYVRRVSITQSGMRGTVPERKMQREVGSALEAFRSALEETLTSEARRHLSERLKLLTADQTAFRVDDVQLDVVVRDLQLSRPTTLGADESAAAPPARSTRQLDQSGPDHFKARSVRSALLAAFDSHTDDLDTETLRHALDDRGVHPTPANLHQHLRRLVQSEHLERVERGVYRRVSPSHEAS